MLNDFRVLYAALVTAGAATTDSRLVEAFGRVERERYSGPGPWRVFTPAGYIETPSAEPALLYQDILVALDADRMINNGAPSLHARCMAQLGIGVGATVLHVGAGAGYYTAILADLVGPAGRVIAYEIDKGLAQRAQANLADVSWVEVRCTSALEGELPAADVIYASAGASHPPVSWLKATNSGGRLLFPLTCDEGDGVMLRLERQSGEAFAAASLGRCVFVPCEGARSAEASARLRAALGRDGGAGIRSLRMGSVPDDSCWADFGDAWLSTSSDA